MPSITTDRFVTEVLPILSSDAVYRYALRRLRDEDAAEECSARVAERAVRYRSHLTDESKPRAWVFAIARSVVINYVGERKRRDRLAEAAADEPMFLGQAGADAADMESSIDRRREIDLLAAIVAALPSENRHAVEGQYLRDRSTHELAVEAGVRQGTILSRTYRGIRKVREAAGIEVSL